MENVKTLLAICRVSNLPTVWMNVLSAAVLAQATPPPVAVALLIIALSASYCGGMVLNDYFDRAYDAREQPFRPIPSGRIREEQALWLAAGLLGLGIVLLVLAPNGMSVLPGAILLVAIVVYDRWHKSFPGSVFLMASTRTLVYVVTASALVGSVAALVWIAAAASFFWTLSVTVVARSEAQRPGGFGFPVIPWMIAGMATLDGVLLAVFVDPLWLVVGLGMTGLTRLGQRYVRGD